MTHTEIVKKLKRINAIQKEWDTLNALISAMKNCKKKGLEIPENDLEYALRRQKRIDKEFENLLK